MRHDFYLAWRYLRHHRTRSLILVSCLSLLALLPIALHRVLDEGERLMTARAAATPLLVGARGSAVDLTLNALYFNSTNQPSITMAESDRVGETGWADPLPLYVRYRVQGHPLVGVTLDYFDFRKLDVVQGNMLTLLGECVIGADAATEMHLKPGDTLVTTPENLFDLAGVYPLKLHVVGVLGESHSPDDQGIFVDLQTAWIIEGLGHGHAELKTDSTGSNLSADAKLVTYTEITPDNIDSFHFHGDPATYPISAVIAVPHDRRSAALLRGRYLAPEDKAQIVRPLETTESLLQNIFRIGALFDGVILLVGAATLLALGLIFALSLRLRNREIHTIHLLGCSPSTVFRLVFAEIVLIGFASSVVTLALLQVMQHYLGDILRRFILP